MVFGLAVLFSVLTFFVLTVPNANADAPSNTLTHQTNEDELQLLDEEAVIVHPETTNHDHEFPWQVSTPGR